MTLIPAFVTRAIDVSGRAIKCFLDGTDYVQAVALVGRQGTQLADAVPSLVMTEVTHAMAHFGYAFIHSEISTCPANGGTVDFVLVNTTALEVHLPTMDFTSTQGNAEIIVYHGITDNDDGTPLLLHNKNLNLDDTHLGTADLYVDPTGITGDTVANEIEHILLVGGKNSGGFASTGADEIILKQNEKVLIRYTNNSNQIDTFMAKFVTLDVGAWVASL